MQEGGLIFMVLHSDTTKTRANIQPRCTTAQLNFPLLSARLSNFDTLAEGTVSWQTAS